jgi:superfamily II DNA/RNA helicase
MCFVGLQRLVQQYLFIPAKYKYCYLAYIVDEFRGQSVIIFVATCNNAQRATVSSARTQCCRLLCLQWWRMFGFCS